jgi:hypothetical protein
MASTDPVRSAVAATATARAARNMRAAGNTTEETYRRSASGRVARPLRIGSAATAGRSPRDAPWCPRDGPFTRAPGVTPRSQLPAQALSRGRDAARSG